MNESESPENSLESTLTEPDSSLPAPQIPNLRQVRWYWLRRLFAGNPFFLISAALLLFGINRLSIDPAFLEKDESSKLLFNFGALQCYEVLLVFVAIILARRRIWYDSVLLVGLENLLVLVPFILVTQALLISKGIASVLCLAGTCMVVLRFASLRKFIPNLNIPVRLLVFGSVLLLLNVAIPVYYRSMVEDSKRDWEPINRLCWLFGVPLLQLLANALSRPRQSGGLLVERSWLPIAFFELWVAATGVHLWAITYISKVAFEPYLLAPFLSALTWTLHNRIGDFVPKPTPALQSACLFPPLAAPVLGSLYENSYLFLALTLFNIIIYANIQLSRKLPYASQLLLGSLFALVAGLPLDLGKVIFSEFQRGHAIVLALGAFIILQAVVSTRPQKGLGGAIMAGITPAFFNVKYYDLNAALQVGLVFLLIHSLFWRDSAHPGASVLRAVAALGWATDAIAFCWLEPGRAGWTVTPAAVLVLMAYGLARLAIPRPPLSVAVSASVSLLATPSHFLERQATHSPDGLLALAASFLMFALGTLAALTKPRWNITHHEKRNDESGAP